MLKIVDVIKNEEQIEAVAGILLDGFSDTGTDYWRTMNECVAEVRGSLKKKKISRVALGKDNEVLGWAAGAPLYRNITWELEVLVVERSHWKQGIGSKLLVDFEEEVRLRKGLSVFLGTDDENYRTSLGGTELYPDALSHLKFLQNIGGHPYEFYEKQGYEVVGVLPDANGIGKPDIYMSKRLT